MRGHLSLSEPCLCLWIWGPCGKFSMICFQISNSTAPQRPFLQWSHIYGFWDMVFLFRGHHLTLDCLGHFARLWIFILGVVTLGTVPGVHIWKYGWHFEAPEPALGAGGKVKSVLTTMRSCCCRAGQSSAAMHGVHCALIGVFLRAPCLPRLSQPPRLAPAAQPAPWEGISLLVMRAPLLI